LHTLLLEIKNLSVDFVNDKMSSTALHDISFSINRGEIVAVVGESGSGKSVTALSILRLLPSKITRFTSGEIVYSNQGSTGTDILKLSEAAMRELRGNDIAMIFQEPMTSLNPVFTCGDQVREAIQLHRKISKNQAEQITLQLFEKVKLPEPAILMNRYPHQLSGGQKQRVMIAMAMSCEPSLLIADEPTTALDVTVQKNILELIRELQKEKNMGVMFITHDFGVVAEIADRVIVMYKGNIVEQGFKKDILDNPQHPYTKALLACRPSMHPKKQRLPVVSDFMGGSVTQVVEKKLTAPVETELIKEKEVLLEVKNLRVWFPSQKTFLGKVKTYTKAVDDVSFELLKGETLGLVGESGCGKTTLGRCLLRLVNAGSGQILYNGTDLLSISPESLRQKRKDMQIVFQDPYSSLNPRLSVGRAILEPLQVNGILKNNQQRKDKVIDLLEKVNLDSSHFNRYPHEFSGGQRQRIGIARALALNPGFIVFDESVSALDVSVQAQVLNLLNDLKREFGFTAIFISHDLSVVRYISDRIMVMNKGKIEEIGDSEKVYAHPQSPYTQKLLAAIPAL